MRMRIIVIIIVRIIITTVIIYIIQDQSVERVPNRSDLSWNTRLQFGLHKVIGFRFVVLSFSALNFEKTTPVFP